MVRDGAISGARYRSSVDGVRVVIQLDSTTKKLEISLSGAITTNQPHITVCFHDVPAQTKTDFSDYRGAPKLTKANSTTAVTICEAPAQNNVTRNVTYISIYNADTVACTVNLRIDDAGTDYTQVLQTLAVGETLAYQAGGGWQVL